MHRQEFPAKLFVEPTTHCNFQCRMCVKQSRGNEIVEGFLERKHFKTLSKIFPHLDTIVFSGIGEPLLHPELETMIADARPNLPANSWIGLQTNGHLMDDDRAAALITAGVDRICISMDAALGRTLKLNRLGADMEGVENALQAVTRAKKILKADKVQLGIEYVLMRNNLEELPRALEQAASRGATFAIVTQMLPYDERVVEEALYSANTDASLIFFRKRQKEALLRNLDFKKYFSVRWKYVKSDRDRELIAFVEAMISEASERRIPFHLKKLLTFDESPSKQVKAVFERAKMRAKEHGLNLQLPALHPKFERQCDFIKNRSVFLAWDGHIYPCYMLWHQYKCFFDGREKPVSSKTFGQLPDQDILEIWRSSPYKDFRKEVVEYEFPYCSNCNLGPCDLISSEGFEYDCFAREVPCGDCPWCMGLMQCLQ
jgi:putative metalloenzyme radical SAM/SPASM domain maturase